MAATGTRSMTSYPSAMTPAIRREGQASSQPENSLAARLSFDLILQLAFQIEPQPKPKIENGDGELAVKASEQEREEQDEPTPEETPDPKGSASPFIVPPSAPADQIAENTTAVENQSLFVVRPQSEAGDSQLQTQDLPRATAPKADAPVQVEESPAATVSSDGTAKRVSVRETTLDKDQGTIAGQGAFAEDPLVEKQEATAAPPSAVPASLKVGPLKSPVEARSKPVNTTERSKLSSDKEGRPIERPVRSAGDESIKPKENRPQPTLEDPAAEFQRNRRSERLEEDRRDRPRLKKGDDEFASPVALDSQRDRLAEPAVEVKGLGGAADEFPDAAEDTMISQELVAQDSRTFQVPSMNPGEMHVDRFKMADPSVNTKGAGGVSGIQSAESGAAGFVGGGVRASSETSGRSANVSGSSSSTLSPYQEQRVLHRVLRGLEQLDQGSGQVRLRLHPPELGSLQVTIRVESQRMAARIEVEHVAARDILTANITELTDRLAEQGVEVQQLEITLVENNQWSDGQGLMGNGDLGQQTGDGKDRQSTSRYLDRLRNQIEETKQQTPSPAPRAWSRNQGQLDLQV
jgi:flagellar hook-length control protein FliK